MPETLDERGRKTSQWMWFIYPQPKGLGRSPTTLLYGITGNEEALAYLDHTVLGNLLKQISQLLVDSKILSATEIQGRPDDRKLQSCVTLFHCVAPEEKIFLAVLEKFFGGRSDRRTEERIVNGYFRKRMMFFWLRQ
jgi:uncharacterized protein (DUF1810 family)